MPLLERPGDAFLPGLQRPPTPSAFVSVGGFHSVQVNVDSQGHNIPGDAANEPSLAVDPTNGNRIVIGWRQFDHVASNFRQAGNAYSMDGGQTWHNQTVLTPGTFRSDPVLATDAVGNFFYNSLQSSFFTDQFESTTQGVSWQLRGPADGGDKQWMTIDRTNGIGRGNLYEAWSTAGNNWGGRQFSRSTDGGATWLDPINIPGSPIWGTLDVDTGGNLVLCGLGGSNFEFCRSSNAQDSTQIPSFDRAVSVNLGGAIVFGAAMNPAGLMGQTWLAVDKSSGRTAGNIYMLCSVGVDSQNPCQVNFVRSTDGGLTWSSPKTLNDDAPNTGASHWFGTLAVAPDGRIDVCWYDNRANPSINDSALFTTSSIDGGATWSSNVQLSPYFNPNIGYPNQQKMGDYLGMVSDNGGANIAYAATFNGEEDVWFLRVPVTATRPVNATAIKTYQGTYAGGILPDVWYVDGAYYNIGSTNLLGLGYVAAAQTDFTLPSSEVGALAVNLRASTTVTTTGMVWLYNWQTQQYDFRKAFPWQGGPQTSLTVNFGSVPSAYIDANRRVRCVVRFLTPGRLAPRPFTLQLDQIQLLYG